MSPFRPFGGRSPALCKRARAHVARSNLTPTTCICTLNLHDRCLAGPALEQQVYVQCHAYDNSTIVRIRIRTCTRRGTRAGPVPEPSSRGLQFCACPTGRIRNPRSKPSPRGWQLCTASHVVTMPMTSAPEIGRCKPCIVTTVTSQHQIKVTRSLLKLIR